MNWWPNKMDNWQCIKYYNLPVVVVTVAVAAAGGVGIGKSTCDGIGSSSLLGFLPESWVSSVFNLITSFK